MDDIQIGWLEDRNKQTVIATAAGAVAKIMESYLDEYPKQPTVVDAVIKVPEISFHYIPAWMVNKFKHPAPNAVQGSAKYERG
jgi:hypothetical protein